jgi:hypothetical protein
MKKFVLMIAAMFVAVSSANAQITTENQKLFDNMYVGVEVGATTPLNFNSVFPLNTVAGIKVGKELTPVFGLEVEGLAVFADNVYRYGYESSTPIWDENAFNLHENGSVNTFVKAANFGLNGVINWSNFLFGYQGTPRPFEVKTNTGIGFVHYFGEYTSDKPIGGYKIAGSKNVLTAKTAVDFAFNLGVKKAHTLTVSPGVYWCLNEEPGIHFNKSYAQLGLMVGYTYHFKTSNGTRHFKTYDVGAMLSEINRLNDENADLANKLAEKPKVVAAKPVVKVVKDVQYVTETRYVLFAKDSYELDSVAMAELNKVEGIVNVYGYASPEGSETYNKELSQKRADTVAAYLRNRNVGINEAVGKGVVGIASNRMAIIHSAPIPPNED